MKMQVMKILQRKEKKLNRKFSKETRWEKENK